MARFRVDDPSLPRPVFINAPKNASEEDKLEVYNQLRSRIEDAQLKLSDYREPTGRDRPSKGAQKENLKALFAQGIGLENPDEFNIYEGLPFSERLGLDFLPTETDKIQFLQEKYGADNVGVVPFKGKPVTFYKDPSDNKFRLVDEYGASLSDFTADITSEIPALLVATGAVAAAPFTGGTSLGALVATGALSAGAYTGTKAAQDAIARGVVGDDVDAMDIIDRRGTEFLIQAPIDMATMGAGRLLKGALPNGAKGVVANQVRQLEKEAGVTVPKAMLQRADRPEVVRQLAEKRPDSNIGKIFERNRTILGRKARELFSGDISGTIKNKYGQFIEKTQNNYNRIKNKLDSVRAEQQIIKGTKPSTTRPDVKERVAKGLERDLAAKADRLRAPEDVGMGIRESGNFVQRAIFSQLYKIERTRKGLYEKVNDLMKDVPITADELNDALQDAFLKIRDFKDFDFIGDAETRKILSKFRPVKVKEGTLSSIEKLDELADVANISFRELDDLIKAIDGNIVYTQKGVDLSNPAQSALVTLRNQLDALRTAKIQEGGAAAQKAFRAADRYFKKTVLPYRQRFDSVIELQRGQSRNNVFDQLDKLAAGGRKTPPKIGFFKDGSAVVNEAFKTPEQLARIIAGSGNDLTVKKILRKKWMESKKLNALSGESKFSLGDIDREIIEILWNKGKIRDFEILARQVGKKKQLTEFQTNRVFRTLEKADTGLKEKQLRQLIDEEAALTGELDRFNRDLLQLVIKGEAPAPENIGGFAKIILGKKDPSKTIEQLYNAVGGRDSLGAKQLQEAMFEEILKQARKGKIEFIQEGTDGILWNPQTMRGILEKKEEILKNVWGKSRYDKFKLFNEGLDRFGIRKLTRKERSEMRIGTAVSGQGRISLFLTSIPSWASSKFSSAVWGAEGYDFLNAPVTSLLKGASDSPEVFAKLLEGRIKTILAGSKGIGNMLLSGENDPVFDAYIADQYMRYLQDVDQDDLADEEDILAAQERAARLEERPIEEPAPARQPARPTRPSMAR